MAAKQSDDLLLRVVGEELPLGHRLVHQAPLLRARQALVSQLLPLRARQALSPELLPLRAHRALSSELWICLDRGECGCRPQKQEDEEGQGWASHGCAGTDRIYCQTPFSGTNLMSFGSWFVETLHNWQLYNSLYLTDMQSDRLVRGCFQARWASLAL